jgi:hypothetical protein
VLDSLTRNTPSTKWVSVRIARVGAENAIPVLSKSKVRGRTAESDCTMKHGCTIELRREKSETQGTRAVR